MRVIRIYNSKYNRWITIKKESDNHEVKTYYVAKDRTLRKVN